MEVWEDFRNEKTKGALTAVIMIAILNIFPGPVDPMAGAVRYLLEIKIFIGIQFIGLGSLHQTANDGAF